MLLSIMGLYEYDNTIFDGLENPSVTVEEETYTVDKDTLIKNICLECAELEVVYPSVDYMKLAIGVWSATNIEKWNRLYKTQVLTYNPLWNVDANIVDTVEGSEQRDIGRTGSGSNNRTVNMSDNETVNLSDNETINMTDTESVKGFNSDSWAETHKNVKAGTDNITHTGTDNVAHTGTDNTSLSSTESVSDDATREETRTQRRTGNIGITSSQSLILAEREVADFSIINYITQAFKERFCLLIY